VKIWNGLPEVWQKWSFRPLKKKTKPRVSSEPVDQAIESLQGLLDDKAIPSKVRMSLKTEYDEVSKLLHRLENEWIQIAVFGRVSVGKSALLNALLGEAAFTTSPLHGETKQASSKQWMSYKASGVHLVDTPGINEVNGEEREYLAHDVANQSDLVLFVVDSDMTASESQAFASLAATNRPIILVLNKQDRYTSSELNILKNALMSHTNNMIDPKHIVFASAAPAVQWVCRIDASGKEVEEKRQPEVEISALKEILWEVLTAEGKTLSALNASLFASQLSDQLGVAIIQARKDVGDKVIRAWCIGKGIAVAFNPIPVADLVAAVAVDVSLVMHLSKVYGLPLSKSEASELIKTIGKQMLLVMGTVWAVHLVSSALKLGTGGLSAVVTGGAQGVVAWYSTYVVGQAAEVYLAKGKSWGDSGPKWVIQNILSDMDRDSILNDAKADIRARLSQVS